MKQNIKFVYGCYMTTSRGARLDTYGTVRVQLNIRNTAVPPALETTHFH